MKNTGNFYIPGSGSLFRSVSASRLCFRRLYIRHIRGCFFSHCRKSFCPHCLLPRRCCRFAGFLYQSIPARALNGRRVYLCLLQYYFRNAGGFAVKGYVFSFAALTAVQSAFPVPEKSADGKNKRLMLSFFVASALLFAAISAFSAYACIFRSAVTASAVMRLCGFPMLFLLQAAVCSGMKCGIIGRIAYYAARIFSFAVAAFVFVTSFAFDSAGTLCTVFSVFYAVFILLCIADLLKSRR